MRETVSERMKNSVSALIFVVTRDRGFVVTCVRLLREIASILLDFVDREIGIFKIKINITRFLEYVKPDVRVRLNNYDAGFRSVYRCMRQRRELFFLDWTCFYSNARFYLRHT